MSTCGHHLHLRCLHAYLRSIHGAGSARAAPGVERGEYLCPVCRQLANAALPLAPRPPRLTHPAEAIGGRSLRDMLAREHPVPVSTWNDCGTGVVEALCLEQDLN